MYPKYLAYGRYLPIGKLEWWDWYVVFPAGRKHLFGKWYWRVEK